MLNFIYTLILWLSFAFALFPTLVSTVVLTLAIYLFLLVYINAAQKMDVILSSSMASTRCATPCRPFSYGLGIVYIPLLCLSPMRLYNNTLICYYVMIIEWVLDSSFVCHVFRSHMMLLVMCTLCSCDYVHILLMSYHADATDIQQTDHMILIWLIFPQYMYSFSHWVAARCEDQQVVLITSDILM